MTSRHWHREAAFTATAETVLALVGDPLRLPELHPLIERVERAVGVAEAGSVAFTVREHVPLGPFRLKNVYRVVVHDTGRTDTLHQVGTSFPRVVVDTTWVVVPTATGCHATWDVTLTAPRLVAPFVFDVAGRAHDRVLAALQARLA
jgi:hypothetical protein